MVIGDHIEETNVEELKDMNRELISATVKGVKAPLVAKESTNWVTTEPHQQRRVMNNLSFQMIAGRIFQNTIPTFIVFYIFDAVHFKHKADQIYSFLLVLFILKYALNVKNK